MEEKETVIHFPRAHHSTFPLCFVDDLVRLRVIFQSRDLLADNSGFASLIEAVRLVKADFHPSVFTVRILQGGLKGRGDYRIFHMGRHRLDRHLDGISKTNGYDEGGQGD
jgi:hypothetical protein